MEENQVFVVNGIEIFCQKVGSGSPLVFLHGNGESHAIFAEHIPTFATQYQVIAPDTRGHGASTNNGLPLSFELLALDLKLLLDTLGVKKAHIIGFSDGGNTALYFAKLYPKYVDKMVLIGVNTKPSGLKFRVKLMTSLEYYEARLRGVFFKKYRQKANILQLMTKHPNLSTEELKRIEAANLLLFGEDDVITTRHLQYLRKQLPHNVVRIIPGATHFLMMEYPKLFRKIVFEFLGE